MTITELDLTAALLAEFDFPELDPQTETCTEMLYAAQSGAKSRRAISDFLDKQHEAGKLVRHWAMYRGRKVWAYRRKE